MDFSEKHPNESLLQFNDLMQLLDVHEQINVFLLMGSSNKQIVSSISRYFENNPERFKRIIICSRSPVVIYQVKIAKMHFMIKFIRYAWDVKTERINSDFSSFVSIIRSLFAHFGSIKSPN